MSEATNLVPKLHLMQKLSPSWRKRFDEALALIHDEKELTWQEVADQCAISSYHFLRIFRLVFNETPRHYKARIRLQSAVILLIDNDELSMTEIAHDEGYSSSQFLAKALKRELGYSAKEIRKMGQHFGQIQPI
jgi:transcriptional regulator GlxA family with amidase domain